MMKRTLDEIKGAEMDGWRARHEGFKFSDNPYGESELVVAWGAGWYRARSEQRAGIHAPDCTVAIGDPCNCGAEEQEPAA